MFSPGRQSYHQSLALSVICLGLSFLATGTAHAQEASLWSSFYPYVAMPYVQGEIKAMPTASYISKDSNRNILNMTSENYFIDLMARFQMNRLSLRMIYEPRDFVGFRGGGEARFSYVNLRVGSDFDLIQSNRSRLGINFDYSLMKPEFFVSPLFNSKSVPPIYAHPQANNIGVHFSGNPAATLGIHLVYNPVTSIYGVSGIIESKARWPLTSTEVTEWDVSAGLKTAETVLGSWALKFGFRNTNIFFKDKFRGQNTIRRDLSFDTSINGWFGELTYLY